MKTYTEWRDLPHKGVCCLNVNGTGNFVIYYNNKKRHRIGGPAYASVNGTSWWIDGIRFQNNKLYQEAAGLSDEEMSIMILKFGNVS